MNIVCGDIVTITTEAVLSVGWAPIRTSNEITI